LQHDQRGVLADRSLAIVCVIKASRRATVDPVSASVNRGHLERFEENLIAMEQFPLERVVTACSPAPRYFCADGSHNSS
jgi:hypothetical protein